MMDKESNMEIIDTKELQIRSLLDFALGLEYTPINDKRINKGFVIIDMRSWHTHYISASDMARLHNRIKTNIWYNGNFRGVDWTNLEHLDIAPSSLSFALKRKLVERVKLQFVTTYDEFAHYWGEELGVKVQSHKVELTAKGKAEFGEVFYSR